MCKSIKLVSNKNGSISQCKGCNKFQIVFGTSILCLSVKAFYTFSIYLYKLRGFGDGFKLHEKGIFIRTESKNVALLVSPYELEHLIDLVETAILKTLLTDSMSNLN